MQNYKIASHNSHSLFFVPLFFVALHFNNFNFSNKLSFFFLYNSPVPASAILELFLLINVGKRTKTNIRKKSQRAFVKDDDDDETITPIAEPDYFVSLIFFSRFFC